MPSDDQIIVTDEELIGEELTVSTDLDDYPPEAMAEITATGVDVGGTVTFEVEHVSDAGADGIYGTADDTTVDLGGEGHDSWTVTDGGEGDLDGVANGTVVTNWYVNPDDSLGERFLLSADDGTDTAYHTFTDGPAPAYNLDQWKNGSSGDHLADGDAWANGNLNGSQAHYYEDDFVPYRATVSNLETGTYFLTIEWDTTEGGQASIDHLGTYDAGYTGSGFHSSEPVVPDPGDGVVLDDETSTLEIVKDPFYATNDLGDPQQAGVFTMYDATLLGYAVDTGGDGFGNETDVYYINTGPDTWAVYNGFANYTAGIVADTFTSDQVGGEIYNQVGDTTANSQNSLTVIFEYNNETDGDAVLAWSGHIGSNEDWDGQANPSGSPYHMRLLNIAGYEDDGTEIVDGGGNQDRSLSRTAIILDNPAFEIEKLADVTEVDAAGDVITYTINVYNTGDTELTGININDPLLDNPLANPTGDTDGDGNLDVGETWVYTGIYTVTQADIDSNGTAEPDDNDMNNGIAANPDGDIDNTVTVSFAQVTDPKTASVEVGIVYAPALAIDKTITSVTDVNGNGLTDAGDIINYNVNVANTGNVTLTGVTVSDPLLGGTLASGVELAVGQDADYTGSYTITQADIDSNGNNDDGDIDNTATADSNETDPETDSEEQPIDYAPALAIDKQTVLYTAEGGIDQIGDDLAGAFIGQEVSWQYAVTNTGNVTIDSVYIFDDNGTPGDTSDDFDTGTLSGDVAIVGVEVGGYNTGDLNQNNLLDVGETWYYESDPNLTIPEGTFSYTNVAYATGTTTLGVDTDVAQDDSGYVVLNNGYVTNSSFCVIEDFNVLFSPNMDGTYTETSTQPGQFFYNYIGSVEDVADNTITLHIPDGFALQSPDAFFESAVHVYDKIEVDPNCPELGFIWGDELSQQHYTVYYIYYGDTHMLDPEGRGEVIATDPTDPNYGSFDVVVTFDPDVLINGDGEMLEGNFAINVHLDHETEGSDGWSYNGGDAVAGPGPDTLANDVDVYGTDTILNGTNYEFYTSTGVGPTEEDIVNSYDNVVNINDFKDFKMKGVGGFIWDDANDNYDYDSGEGLEGYKIELSRSTYDRKTGETVESIVETVYTDEDGWYHTDYAHKGKAADYTVTVYDGDTEVATSDPFSLGQGDHFEIFNWEDDSDLVAEIA